MEENELADRINAFDNLGEDVDFEEGASLFLEFLLQG